MADNRTEKSCYESRFGGGWITAAQYLAENMVARRARSEKTSLPPKFWEIDKWKKDFLLQIRHANTLLADFCLDAILRTLRNSRCKNVYSLGLKSVIMPVLKDEQARIKTQMRKLEEMPVVEEVVLPAVAEPPRPSFQSRNSMLSKLRGLE